VDVKPINRDSRAEKSSDMVRVDNVYDQMLTMVLGYWVSQTIRAVADMSIADHFAQGSLSAADIAEREHSAPDTTLRLLRAAVSTGLLESESGGRFRATPLLETLRKDDPRTLRPFALAVTGAAHWRPWSEFTTAIRTGGSQVKATLGMTLFEYYQNNPKEAEEFSAAMRSLTSLWGESIAKVIDTEEVQCAVDVGGANGSLLQFLQQANPALRGIVFDLPNVVEHARVQIARTGFPDRTKLVGGDFFESVPGGDLYLLKFILHDWSDDESIAILRCCRQAMVAGGRIAIIEYVVGERNPLAALTDMDMLALTTGKERSGEEYEALLRAAGLQRTALRETGTPMIVIEAIRADDV
jgi:hypothetical protein